MKYFLILIFIINSNLIISQQKNCFDIARNGTLNEIISEYNGNKKVIDSIECERPLLVVANIDIIDKNFPSIKIWVLGTLPDYKTGVFNTTVGYDSPKFWDIINNFDTKGYLKLKPQR